MSLDGAYLLMATMVIVRRWSVISRSMIAKGSGNIRLFGERPNTAKPVLNSVMQEEINRIKARYPDALYLGIADGAKDNWAFLTPHTDCQLLNSDQNA